MRLYVIGAISGRPHLNASKFTNARCDLKEACETLEVIIPHDFADVTDPWERAMRKSIRRMVSNDIDGVAYLDDWQESRGARIEKQLCEDVGVPVKSVSEWIKEIK